LHNVRYNILSIEEISNDDVIFKVENKYYRFNDKGKLAEMQLEISYSKLKVYDEKSNFRFASIKGANNPPTLFYYDDRVKEYIEEQDYKIEYYETVNGENFKVFEMIFNKDIEIEQLFIRKIDYLDGTIGETIIIKFDKGKVVSEVRDK
jgi:hypothetical protein